MLATLGTRTAGTYEQSAANRGIEIAYPNESTQVAINHLIFEFVKAGKEAPESMLDSAIDHLIDAGADGVILGCTELSVAAGSGTDPLVIDSLDSLARRTVVAGGARLIAAPLLGEPR